MIGHLYIITNSINGKQYVGKTYDKLEDRWASHVRDAKRFPDRPLYRAFIKYGVENFTIKLVDNFKAGLLEEEEIALISKLNTYNKGYNATLGGDSRRTIVYEDSIIINKYYELECSQKDTAKYFNIDAKSVFNILKRNDISDRVNKGKKVFLKELNLSWDSVTDCANFLVEADIAPNPNVETVRKHLNRHLLGHRSNLYGFVFSRV